MNTKPDTNYLIPDRLADVIQLINALSVTKHNFRKEEALNNDLRGKPKSANGWFAIAKDHPEFFRFNKEKTCIVLAIRFLLNMHRVNDELRPPLSFDQSIKLVDQAIALHDKQLARYQRDSSKTAVLAAYIAAFATVITGIISYIIAIQATADIKSDLTIIKEKIEKPYVYQPIIPVKKK